MQQRLLDIGNWLAINGEAIYNTRRWDQAPSISAETSVFFTRKGNDLYAICTSFSQGQITIKGVKKPTSVSMLGFAGKVTYTYSGDLKISVPAFSPDNIPCQYAWVFKVKNAF
jgi:alpha-L-fucosidase